MPTFYDYFKENMEGLGLPAPESLFGNVSTASGTAATILGGIDKFGAKVTVTELIGAGTKLEKLAIIGACSASFYAGAVIGSIAVASGRYFSGGTSLADVIESAMRNDTYRPWLTSKLRDLPGIYNRTVSNRSRYRMQFGYP
jgi:hypothetical protein